MWNPIQSISALILPRRLRRWVSTSSQDLIPKSHPLEDIRQHVCLNKTRTQLVAGAQVQERNLHSRILGAIIFHRATSRIPNTKTNANSNRPTIQPNIALASGSSFYSPQHGFTDVESNPNSKRITIGPNNALGLYFDTPSPRPFNVESLDEAESDETPFEALGFDFGQDLQTMGLSANHNRPIIDPSNALGLSLGSPQHVQPFNASPWWYTMHNNALGLPPGSPLSSVGIELLHPCVPVPLEFQDDPDPWTTAWEEPPQVGQLTSYLDFFGKDLQTTQTRTNFSQSPTEPDNSNIATRKFIPNPTPWRIEVPPPGAFQTNFDPFREELQTHTPSANLSRPENTHSLFQNSPLHDIDPGSVFSYSSGGDTIDSLGERPSKSEELSVTFGGNFGRQVRWENIMPSVDHFLERCAWDTTHRLDVVLKPSSTPYDRWERGWTLKQLFNSLSKEPVTDNVDGCRNIGLSVFHCISIAVPDDAEDVDMMSVVAWPSSKFPGHKTPNDNPESIDITSASNLREFLWKGPFQQLSNFLYPADGLTLLSITGCRFSVGDAVDLLQPCSFLEEVQLETIHCAKAAESLTLKPGSKFKFSLHRLSVISSVDLVPFLELITWAPEPELNLTFLKNGAQNANILSHASVIPQNAMLRLKGNC